jgi:hypothetical protein
LFCPLESLTRTSYMEIISDHDGADQSRLRHNGKPLNDIALLKEDAT